MTNRDIHNPEFIRKVVDYYDCISNYFKISDINKLKTDILKPDIDLVCNYELHELKKHSRLTNGLSFIDFVKLHPKEEKLLQEKFKH